MSVVSTILKLALLVAIVVATPLSSSAVSAKIAKVERTVATQIALAGAGRQCAGIACVDRIDPKKLECLAAVALCSSALAAILPNLPVFHGERGRPVFALEPSGLTVHTSVADPPPPRGAVA